MVDRFKVRPDIAQRLAESFETALRLGDGVARLAPMERTTGAPRRRCVFSNRYACPVCGYSVAELEPRLFSFNNPAGACPTCDGLATRSSSIRRAWSRIPQLSLAGGAIRGWDRRNAYYFQMIRALAQHYGFDIEAPWAKLPANDPQVVLHGSGEDEDRVPLHRRPRRQHRRKHPSRASCRTSSAATARPNPATVREELGKYLGTRPARNARARA